MGTGGFEGWYFKHQKGDDMVAFIPGRAESGAFVQMITPHGSRQYDVPELTVTDGVIRAGDCVFSRSGCRISLPGVSGQITYGLLTPLRSDIMGPFRHFPMECRHGVISMAHSLSGRLTLEDGAHDLDGGTGYIEKDSGTSFPRAYLWMQCNDFPEPCSVMVSVARVPFGPLVFRGCICALWFRGREYRFATYNGVRIRTCQADHLCLSRGSYRLELDMKPSHEGHPLRSPVEGAMTGIIRESCNAAVRLRLWARGQAVLDLSSDRAAYEYVPGSGGQL